MTVYVDDMRARFGRMIMCHMIADTDEELHALAERIGVARRWHQSPPRHDSHYDIALSKRALAIKHGAVEITWRQAGAMATMRRVTGTMGSPAQAEAWLQVRLAQRREAAASANGGSDATAAAHRQASS
jgi:hypothetical protein